MYGLTHRQRDRVGLILRPKAMHGVPPSVEDMAEGRGLASTSGVARRIVTFSSDALAAIASRAEARGMAVEQVVACSARVIAGVPR